MFPNLLGQKAFHHMTDADMAKALGISRNAYAQKIRSGRFTPRECKTLCDMFGKSFEYLFAEDGEVEKITAPSR